MVSRFLFFFFLFLNEKKTVLTNMLWYPSEYNLMFVVEYLPAVFGCWHMVLIAMGGIA